MILAIAIGSGLIIGMLLGLLGGGGSILALPVLVLVLGLSVAEAVPTALIVVGAAAAGGAIPKIRANLVQWRLATVFAAAGIPGAFLGSAAGRLLPESAVLAGFALVMVAAGVRILAGDGATRTACSVGDSGINWHHCAPRAVPAGFAVGVLTGLFGVGGGFLIIPALVLLLGIEMPVAIGTSLLIIVANSVAGVAAHLRGGVSVDPAITIGFAGAAVLAAYFAGRIGNRLDTEGLQRWFAYLVFGVAAYVLIDILAATR